MAEAAGHKLSARACALQRSASKPVVVSIESRIAPPFFTRKRESPGYVYEHELALRERIW